MKYPNLFSEITLGKAARVKNRIVYSPTGDNLGLLSSGEASERMRAYLYGAGQSAEPVSSCWEP